MKREHFEDGLTVAELKRIIADWPEADEQGEPCEVWLADARGVSNQACTVSPLNARTSEDGKHSWADLMLQHLEDGLTVAELKRIIADWPEADEQGEPCEVWLADARGVSNQACTVSPLNARTSEDGKHSWADLMLQHRA